MQRQIISSLAKSQTLQRGLLRPAASLVQSRPVSTHTVSPEAAAALLNKQRDIRPNSPWAIYKPQLTWVPSIVNRATGVFLSAGIYGLFLGHLALPAIGIPFDSATIISAFADSPDWFKLLAKTAVAFPASFHSINGLRHLGWDTGYFLSLKSSYAAGYATFAATAASTIGLVFYV